MKSSKKIDIYLGYSLAFLVPFFGIIAYVFVNFSSLSMARIAIALGAAAICFSISLALAINIFMLLKEIKDEK